MPTSKCEPKADGEFLKKMPESICSHTFHSLSRQDYFVLSELDGYYCCSMGYFAIQIPTLVSYHPTEKLYFLGGVNLMWASWDQYTASWEYNDSAIMPEVSTISNEEIPDIQFVAE